MKISFVVWGQLSKRSEQLAEQLGADLHFIASGMRRRPVNAPIRYTIQALRTWKILRTEKPDIVFVQNPPIFCALIAFLNARWHAAAFALDSHTGAFIGSKWRWSLRLHKMLSRRALVNIVHNKSVEEFVKAWGCPYLLIGMIPGEYPQDGEFLLTGDFNVAVVSTFATDEPLDAIFEAAKQLPGADFYVTGNSKHIAPRLLAQKPANCHLTGFLDYPTYIALLRDADVVMDLTTRNHTVLMGGFEAISLGTPLITSDWPVLVDYFSLGTIHIPNTVQGICDGVRRAQQEHQALEHGMLQLREKTTRDWSEAFVRLQKLLGTG